FWLPFGLSPDELANQRSSRYLRTAARLKAGVTEEQARIGLLDLSATVRTENPKFYGTKSAKPWYMGLTPLRDRFVGTARQPLLGFACALTILTTLVFGLAPALQATRGELVDSLKDGAHGASSPRAVRLRSALVAGQVALSLVLLIGAGLLLRSFSELLRVNP